MKNSSLLIEHQCPQCGAPVILKETDRLITCEYCRVKSYLLQKDFFRYMLPQRAPEGRSLIYVPYWRFKGMMFSCVSDEIRHRFVDVSQLALESPYFPSSLGLRSQALKLKFVTPEGKGRFLTPHMTLQQAMRIFEKRFNQTLPAPAIHQAYIGEAASLIYSPIYVKDTIYDAVLNQPLMKVPPEGFEAAHFPGGPPEGKIRFLPTLCPSCGWDLSGEPDSQVLSCSNCNSVWQPTARKLVKLKFGHIPPDTDQPVMYFPFWRIHARISGIPLQTAADLIRLANLPKVIRKRDSLKGFRFWALAFKVRPQMFVRLASNVTLSQPEAAMLPKLPQAPLHPVNLPIMEAVESLKIILAGFIKPRHNLFPRLPEISIRPVGFKLVYIPFVESHHEFIQPMLKVAINKNMLALSRNL